jgi:hypothetical protein
LAKEKAVGKLASGDLLDGPINPGGCKDKRVGWQVQTGREGRRENLPFYLTKQRTLNIKVERF